MYSRDVERGVGPEVGGGNAEALLDLVLTWGAIMLNVAVLGLDVVGVEIGNCGDVGVSDQAVVALVVVVGQDLPVEVAIHVPSVVEVVVLEVVVLESGLLIDALKVVLPGHLGGLLVIQVDPDKAIAVEVDMDGEEVGAVESVDLSLWVLGDDEVVASSLVRNPVTGVGDTVLVGGQEPLAGEDGPSLELVHFL